MNHQEKRGRRANQPWDNTSMLTSRRGCAFYTSSSTHRPRTFHPFWFCWKTSGRDCQVNAETLIISLCNWLRRVFGRERERRILRRVRWEKSFHMKAAHCEGWMRSDGLDMHVNGRNNNDWHGYGRETHTLRLQKRSERKVWIVLPPLAVHLHPSEWQPHPVTALKKHFPWNLTTTDKSYYYFTIKSS